MAGGIVHCTNPVTDSHTMFSRNVWVTLSNRKLRPVELQVVICVRHMLQLFCWNQNVSNDVHTKPYPFCIRKNSSSGIAIPLILPPQKRQSPGPSLLYVKREEVKHHVGKMTTIVHVVMVSYLSPRYSSSFYHSEHLPTTQKWDVFLAL